MTSLLEGLTRLAPSLAKKGHVLVNLYDNCGRAAKTASNAIIHSYIMRPQQKRLVALTKQLCRVLPHSGLVPYSTSVGPSVGGVHICDVEGGTILSGQVGTTKTPLDDVTRTSLSRARERETTIDGECLS